MISNKALATIFLITLNIQLFASASFNDTLGGQIYLMDLSLKKQKLAPKRKANTPMLRDTTSTADPVEVQGGSTGEMSTLQGQPVSQINSQFEELISQRKYKEIFELGREVKMKRGEFMKQLGPVVKTFGRYNGLATYLKRHKMMVTFYVHGDIEVVKRVIIESRVYVNDDYVDDGDLETALPLALEKDCHDRVIDLFNVRKEITAEKDEQLKQKGDLTSFEDFMSQFLYVLAPWEDGMALRRFLTFRGNELRVKHPDILDILCEKLVDRLKSRLKNPHAENLLIDLIGQPSLLTSVSFVKGFLTLIFPTTGFNFIKYGWSQAIEEGLKEEHYFGGKELWRVMQKERPNQFSGEYPETEEARAAVLKHFPTKERLEEEWAEKNAKLLYAKFKNLGFIPDLLPIALWSIISDYAISWTDV